MKKYFLAVLFILILTGCTTTRPPFDKPPVDYSRTPLEPGKFTTMLITNPLYKAVR